MSEEDGIYVQVLKRIIKDKDIESIDELNSLMPKINLDDYREESPEFISKLLDLKNGWNELSGLLKPFLHNHFAKPQIILPCTNRLVSTFATDVSKQLQDKNHFFFRAESKEVVEIIKIKKFDRNGNERFITAFQQIEPERFVTQIEKFITPGMQYLDKKNRQWVFEKKSMSNGLSKQLLCSEILQNNLPPILRIFNIPLPLIYKGQIIFPKKGYDERFYSWLPEDSPEILYPEMTLEDAKKGIANLFREFVFQTKRDYLNAIAGIITPFLRGLFSQFNTRCPVFFYIANRERSGKDYCAGMTGIIYEGHALEEPPISVSNNSNSGDDELRKKLLAALKEGRKRLHFSNNKGLLDNAVLESFITLEKFSDRLLGKNITLSFENEVDVSLSGNVGIRFTPDFANRSKFVRLFLDIENANERKFNNPYLHDWIKQNRDEVLSYFFALVRNWYEKGMPEGKNIFASFPEWASICGGIMEAAGYENPCGIDKEAINLGGDVETDDMKLLFETCYNVFTTEEGEERAVFRKDIIDMINQNQYDFFEDINFNEKRGQMNFAKILNKFVGRIFSDIKLVVTNPKEKSGKRLKYKFTKKIIRQSKEDIFGYLQ